MNEPLTKVTHITNRYTSRISRWRTAIPLRIALLLILLAITILVWLFGPPRLAQAPTDPERGTERAQ